MCWSCRVEKFFERILFKPLGFVLMDWQRDVLRRMYRVRAEDGARIVRRSYVEIPKKNGKSMLVGGLPLFHLIVEADNIVNPEAYSAAACREQAAIAFRAACRMTTDNEYLRDRLKIISSTKRIVRKDGHGFYACLTADGGLQDGIEPSLAIIDELHRLKTEKAKELRHIIVGGTISQPNSLVAEITTAGDVFDSPVAWPQHEYAQAVLDGTIKSDSFLPMIWSANQKRIREDPTYWNSRAARAEANPSHEDNGGFIKDTEMATICEEAAASPAAQAAYERLHLNIWGQKAERWMDMHTWNVCGKELRPLIDRPCWLGIDLSSTTAMSAIVCIFRDDDGSLDILPFPFLPEARISEIQKRIHVDLPGWIKQGWLETTPGNVIDYKIIRQKIDWIASVFHIEEICYDPWNATQFTKELVDAGYQCIEVRQSYGNLSPALKYLNEKIVAGDVRHNGHPVLAWHAHCVTVRTDPNGNIMPDKGTLGREGKMIDTISATCTALARMVRLEGMPSAYAGQKIVF